jgi:hypothetical protein
MFAEQASVCERVAIFAPNRLVATFPVAYTSCKTFCERPEQVAKLERALRTVTGKAVRIEFEVADREPAVEDREPVARRSSSPRERLKEKANHPLVRQAMELFDARPVKVEEPAP